MNHSLYLNHHHHRQHRVSNLESFLQSQSRSRRFYVSSRISLQSRRFRFDDFKLIDSNRRKGASFTRRGVVQVRAMDDDDFGGVSFLDDYGGEEQNGDYMYFSSDGDESDGDIILNPIADIDLPSMKEHFVSSNDALTVTAHRFATLGNQHKKHRTAWGVWTNIGLICFLTMLLLLVDWCSWRIVRLPLAPFYLSWPFFLSAVLASCAGYISVPLLRGLKVHQIFISDAAFRHSSKKRTPTLGGLFFIPVGIMVARVLVGFSSTEVSGAALATVAFAAVGLLDDVLRLVNNDNNGLSTWIRISLEVAIGIWFSFWLTTTSISSPYGMKLLIPLPPPLGLANLGKLYLLLTPLCFVSMGNGVDLTDGLDGLAGGTAALAFVGMSIAVLPICSDLSVFGASMAGACVGFLLHNRYRASVFMGDTGSFALGAALAAMASCTGMFIPLFVSSGFFLLEALPLLLKFVYFKPTRRFLGGGRRLFSMFPFHHHLELFGFKEPAIVASAYVVSSILAMLAGYIGLISA